MSNDSFKEYSELNQAYKNDLIEGINRRIEATRRKKFEDFYPELENFETYKNSLKTNEKQVLALEQIKGLKSELATLKQNSPGGAKVMPPEYIQKARELENKIAEYNTTYEKKLDRITNIEAELNKVNVGLIDLSSKTTGIEDNIQAKNKEINTKTGAIDAQSNKLKRTKRKLWGICTAIIGSIVGGVIEGTSSKWDESYGAGNLTDTGAAEEAHLASLQKDLDQYYKEIEDIDNYLQKQITADIKLGRITTQQLQEYKAFIFKDK